MSDTVATYREFNGIYFFVSEKVYMQQHKQNKNLIYQTSKTYFN